MSYFILLIYYLIIIAQNLMTSFAKTLDHRSIIHRSNSGYRETWRDIEHI